MNASSLKGNNAELWERFLNALDDKLQLGLLEHMKRVTSYHFEDDCLFIEPGSPDDYKYLARETVLQQLEVLAQDAVRVERVKLKSAS